MSKKLIIFLCALFILSVFTLSTGFAANETGMGNLNDGGYILILAQDENNPLTKDNTLFIDTRSKDDFQAKHVKGSVNLSIQEAAKNLEEGAFNGKNIFLLYNGASRGGVSWEGIDILGALYSVLVYLYSVTLGLPTLIMSEVIPLILEGFLGIDIDYNQPIPGLPPLDGNLLGIEAPGSLEVWSKSSQSINPLLHLINAADSSGFKGFVIPVEAFSNAVFDTN